MKFKNYLTTENLLFIFLLFLLGTQLFLDMNCFIFFCCVCICIALNVLKKRYRLLSIVAVLIVYSLILFKVMSCKITKKNKSKDDKDVEIREPEINSGIGSRNQNGQSQSSNNRNSNTSSSKSKKGKRTKNEPDHPTFSQQKQDGDDSKGGDAPKINKKKPGPTKVKGVYKTTVIEVVVRSEGDQKGSVGVDDEEVLTFEKKDVPFVA